MVQVGSSQLPGYGAGAAPQPGYDFKPDNYSIGGGAGAPPSRPFDPRGAVQIPNNFWGFAMIVMGMR